MQSASLKGADGHDPGVTEGGGAVGACRNGVQVLGGNVVDEERQDAGRHGRVPFLRQDATQRVEVGSIERRVLLGQVEPAVGGEALQEDVAEGSGAGVGAASGGNVAHASILSGGGVRGEGARTSSHVRTRRGPRERRGRLPLDCGRNDR